MNESIDGNHNTTQTQYASKKLGQEFFRRWFCFGR